MGEGVRGLMMWSWLGGVPRHRHRVSKSHSVVVEELRRAIRFARRPPRTRSGSCPRSISAQGPNISIDFLPWPCQASADRSYQELADKG